MLNANVTIKWDSIIQNKGWVGELKEPASGPASHPMAVRLSISYLPSPILPGPSLTSPRAIWKHELPWTLRAARSWITGSRWEVHTVGLWRASAHQQWGEEADLGLRLLPRAGFGWRLVVALNMSSNKMPFNTLNVQCLGVSQSWRTPTWGYLYH